MVQVNQAAMFSHHILAPDRYCPNNLHLPVIVYRQVFSLAENEGKKVIEHLKSNGWENAWTNGIFDYHHYHSTAHEVLVILNGRCMVELGGDDGNIQTLSKGDVVVLPAGVAHKNVGSDKDFTCIGAYPRHQQYDIMHCKPEEKEQAESNIAKVPLPKTDPVFGNQGPLLHLWVNASVDALLKEEKQF